MWKVTGDRHVRCVEPAVIAIHWCGQTLSGTEGSVSESPGIPCDLFSRSNGSLYPKGHCSSALSPECTEPIIHAQSYNNQTTKEARISVSLGMKHM